MENGEVKILQLIGGKLYHSFDDSHITIIMAAPFTEGRTLSIKYLLLKATLHINIISLKRELGLRDVE